MKNRFLLLTLCVCALACDSANPVAPTGTVLSITASPTQINLNGGTSRITVIGFKPDGNPLNPGTQILVSTDLGDLVHPTSGDRVSVIEVESAGRAFALLRSDGRGGPATVSASLTTGGSGGGEGGGGGAGASVIVQVGETTESQPTLIISANPTTIDIGEESTITVIARASDGSSLGSGQRVRFTTTLGVLDPSEIDTDANGEAEVKLRGDSDAGTADIQAILGTSAPATISVTIRDAAETITVQASPASIPSDGNDGAGATPTTLTALVRNAQGQAFGGAAVNFSARIFGTETSIGTLQSAGGSVLTNSLGEASDTLRIREDELQDTNGMLTVTCIEVRAQVAGAGGALLTATDRVPITGSVGCP